MKNGSHTPWIAKVACMVVLAHVSFVVHAQSAFTYSSEAGDPVGAGKTRTFTPANATFTIESDPVSRNSISVIIDGGDESWGVNLKAPTGEVLSPGRYSDAELFRIPTGRSPGIAVGSNLGGCNDVWGSFEVRQIGWKANGDLSKLEAGFVQQCESADAPSLVGVIRWKTPPLSLTLKGALLDEGAVTSFYGDTSTFRLDGDTQQFFYTASGQRTEWLLLVQAPVGKQLQVGRYVTRNLPTETEAGLSIIHGRMRCQTDSGILDIKRLTLTTDGQIKVMHANFEQRCSGIPGAVKGTIHYAP